MALIKKIKLMNYKIKLSLVISIYLSLSFVFGQRTTNDHKINVNQSSNLHSIENKNTFKLQLDSLIGRDGENRFINHYNYDKNKITEEVFAIVGNKNNPLTKTERIYNDRGLIKVKFKYDWKEELKKYQPRAANGSKTEFIYDDNGDNLFEYQYFWSTDKESFSPYSKKEFKYNEQGNKILRLSYSWNSELEKFNIESKTENKYDEIGKIIESNWYDYKSYKNDNRDEFFLEWKYIFTYSELSDRQDWKFYRRDYDAMLLSNNGEVRYSFKENKKFLINNYIWEAQVLKNKHDNKRVIYSPKSLKLCKNDISTARITSNREYKYDSYGICVLYNRTSVNKVTNTKYISSVMTRTTLVDDEKNLIYHYTRSVYDLDFYNWEIDREWLEYYTKVEK